MQQGQQAIGHPVDIATGVMTTTPRDVLLPGKVDLDWQRQYSSAQITKKSALGPGWTTRYFATLTREKDEYRLEFAGGSTDVFTNAQGLVESGQVFRHYGVFQELSKRNGRYIVTRWQTDSGNIERYIFAAGASGQAWPLIAIENAAEQGLDLTYDSRGKLTTIKQRREERSLSLLYNAAGQLQVVAAVAQDAKQNVARYEYDAQGRLSAAFDAMNRADRYEYDRDGRMIREIFKDGGIFSFTYDPQGRCIRTAGLDGYDEKTLRFIDAARWTEVTDSRGSTSRYHWTGTGQVVIEIDALGAKKQTEFDKLGRIVAMTSALGAVTRYEYDDAGNRSKIVLPGGQEIRIRYNGTHLPTEVTDASGKVWTRRYDEKNRWIAVQNALGHTWKFTYDPHGDLVGVTLPTGASRRLEYNAKGVLVATSDWLGNMTRFAVDAFGRVTRRTDCAGGVTELVYDAMGQVVAIVFPDGAKLSATYDTGGNVNSVTDANGHVRKYRFGPCHRLLEKIDPLGQVTRYTWLSEPFKLEKITDPRGLVHTFAYNPALRLVRETTFEGITFQFEYDLAGNCVAMINGLGERIGYGYDAAGKLISKTLPDGTAAAFEYDVNGNLVSAINPAAAVVFERDAIGRVIKEFQGDYQLDYEYDAIGAVTRVKTSLGHEVQSEYDAKGYLRTIRTNQNHKIEFGFDCRGRERHRLLGGNVHLEQRYDSNGRLIEQAAGTVTDPNWRSRDWTVDRRPGKASPTPRVHRTFAYDPAGNLISIADDRWGATAYSYDPSERLIQSITDAYTEQFSYDPADNVTHMSRTGASGSIATASEDLTYGPGDRLARRDGTRYVHDAHGRLIQKIEAADSETPREWKYKWDGDDQLIEVKRPDGAIFKYAYDALGRRIIKEAADKVTRFVWDQQVIIHCVENEKLSGTWIFDSHSFTPIAQINGSKLYSIVTDNLGTPREMLDSTGAVVWAARFYAWGEREPGGVNNVECPIRFQGQWFDDETGLHYSWFRYFDPRTGRFLCLDPIGVKGGLNEYLYVPNPINWIDPLGLCPNDENPVVITISKKKYPEAAKHIEDNSPVTGRIDRKGAADRRKASLKGKATAPGMDRDEVPPAVLDTGGAGASVRHIPSSDNRGAGSSMGHQMRDLPNGTMVVIVAGD